MCKECSEIEEVTAICEKVAKRLSNFKVRDLETFLIAARETHPVELFEDYDYSKVVYVNSYTKVCIICPKHGKFWITPSQFLKIHKGTGIVGGCQKCGRARAENKKSNKKKQIRFR